MRYNFDLRKGPIKIEWMVGAKTNICYNALDRNIDNGHGDKVAFHWVGNDPQDKGSVTYSQLLAEVCKFANVLESRGVKKGDRVAIYMPMITELVVTMLACARKSGERNFSNTRIYHFKLSFKHCYICLR